MTPSDPPADPAVDRVLTSTRDPLGDGAFVRDTFVDRCVRGEAYFEDADDYVDASATACSTAPSAPYSPSPASPSPPRSSPRPCAPCAATSPSPQLQPPPSPRPRTQGDPPCAPDPAP